MATHSFALSDASGAWTLMSSVTATLEVVISRPVYLGSSKWQARRESNPQPAVLETAALPIELLAYFIWRKSPRRFSRTQRRWLRSAAGYSPFAEVGGCPFGAWFCRRATR